MSEKPTVELRYTESLAKRYHALLLAEWDEKALTESMSIVRSTLAQSGLLVEFPWETETEKPKPKQPRTEPFVPPRAAPYVKEFIERFETSLPSAPETLPTRKDDARQKLANQTQEASLYLVIQSLVRVSGETGFLRDIQSILFNCCIHFLLPDLRTRRMAEEYRLTASSLWLHSKICWDDQPSHKYFLEAQFHKETGNDDEAERALSLAFWSTPKTDHDWITKAQAYWSFLIDTKKLETAETFILDLYRTAPEEHLPEIHEMIREGYAMKFSAMGSKNTRRHIF